MSGDPKKGCPAIWQKGSVGNLCRSMLPRDVGLCPWIEHRLGDEVAVQWDDARQCSVLVLLDTPQDCGHDITKTIDHTAHESYDLADPEHAEREMQNQAKVGAQAKASEFFSSLPEGEFTAEEVELREALLDYLRQ